MKRSRFCSGLLMGTILGSFFGLIYYSHLEPKARGKVDDAHRYMGKAVEMMKDLWCRLGKE